MAAGATLPLPTQGPVIQAAMDESEFEKAVQMLQQTKQSNVDASLIAQREKIFRSNYHQLPPIPHSNLASFVLENATGSFASKTAFVDGSTGTSYSYSQMTELVHRTVAGFVSLGLKPKDVVFLLSPNNPDFAIVYLAVVSLGAIVAPSNPLNTEADIAKQLVQVNAKFVVTVPELLSKFGQNINTLPTILIGDKTTTWELKTTSSISFLSEILTKEVYIEAPQPECHPDDTCTLLFSSGTTGLSKAVQITHRNFMSAVTAYNTLEPGASTTEDDVCLAIVPLYHVYGLGIVFLATLQRGASVVTMARYSLPAMLQYVERFKITVATLVPPIYVVLVKSAELVAKYDLSSLRILATGAAPLREDTMKAIQTMFPHCVIRQGYGMTESPLISFSVIENERQQWGSVGPIVPGTEARISHIETTASLPAMATGEVWIRGPQVMKGYLNDPEQTAAAVDSEGWLHTGDLGYMDNNGYLYIVDRLKEMIKYKAHQVAPGELEAVLLKHPRILDAAVIPFPDDEAGELPMAFVVKREGSDLNESEVMSFVGKLVAPYKKVRKVEFINAIPKSATGKILRKELIVKIRQQLTS
ncbi:hypothetical protein M758_1G291500 [Ceratodon purpureus]|nr:hypothetical protein M758_1G291500 [Ceratodon purpureus]